LILRMTRERAVRHLPIVRRCTEPYTRGMATMTVTEARAALPEVLDRVASGEEITVTRHGRPVAVVVRPDALRARRADAVLAQSEQLGVLLQEAARSPLPRKGLSPERADELVADVRSGRTAR
ncbi:hypothetical protein B7486_72720, partial [cyanobacterium TDX16]